MPRSPDAELPVLQGHPDHDRFGRDRAALRLPAFLKRRVGKGERVRELKRLLRDGRLHTVCEEARCPNLDECFRDGTATFMLMGVDCTRACGFCAVGTAVPGPLDSDEPARIAEIVSRLELEHVVLTSVNRDDLPDGGAAHFRATCEAIRAHRSQVHIEVLTPDFRGDLSAVRHVAGGPISVYNHNVETVPRLYGRVRPRANYQRSLGVLETVAREFPDCIPKSGLMVGLGETSAEVFTLLADLRAAGVRVVTIGQYLRPGLRNVPVVEYLCEAAYDVYRERGAELGFDQVYAGPFVRSSYHAAEARRLVAGSSS